MEALEARDRAMMAKMVELEGLAREASTLPVAEIREDIATLSREVYLLRSLLESQEKKSWWKRKASQTPKEEPDNSQYETGTPTN